MLKPRRSKYWKQIGARAELTLEGWAVMYGVTVADLKALPRIDGKLCVPSDWKDRSEVRIYAARSATGSKAMNTIVDWLGRDYKQVDP